jgi:hypothetical protein
MIIGAVTKPLGCQRTRNIFRISRRGAFVVLITVSTLGPTTALRGYSATRSSVSVAVFQQATRPSRQPMPPRRTAPPDAVPGPSGQDRILDQFYENLMQESTRVLNLHE